MNKNRVVIVVALVGLGLSNFLWAPEDQEISQMYTSAETHLEEVISRYLPNEYASMNKSLMKSKIEEQLGATKKSEQEIKEIVENVFDEIYLQNIADRQEAERLDEQGNLIEGLRRSQENRDHLATLRGRLLYVNAKNHLYYVRSMLQPLKWLCGHLALYNAVHIHDHIKNIMSKDEREWQQMLPTLDAYDNQKFKNFEVHTTAPEAYEGKKTTTEVALEGEDFVRIDDEKDESSYLSETNIITLCKKVGIRSAVIMGVEGNIPYLDESTEEQLNKDFNVRTQEMFDKKISILKSQFDQGNRVHFFCNLENNHWILISLCKRDNAPHMILLDSFNPRISEKVSFVPYIHALMNAFYGTGAYEKLVKEDVLFKTLNQNFYKKYRLSMTQRLRAFWQKIKEHKFKAAGALGIGTLIYLWYKRMTTGTSTPPSH